MPAGLGPPQPPPTSARRLRIALTVALVVAVLALIALAVVVLRGDGNQAAPTTPPAPTATEPATGQATVTPAPSPTVTTAPPVLADTATAVWPVRSSDVRYDDPVRAARGFAVDFVGFNSPVVGAFQQGDSRSGEVATRPTANGPVTTVFVRQLGDGNWWVLGAATEQIRLDAPATGELVSSPMHLTGAAQTFEGHVTVTLREDDIAAPLASGYVTGRMDEMGPFQGDLTFARNPVQRYGALLLTTESAQNGELWQASVIRVQLRP